MKSVTVRYKGEVQGVGFRYTVSSIAKEYPVGGYVKNAVDGCVEIVAEGKDRDLRRFLDNVAQGRLSRYISGVDVAWSNNLHSYSSFGISY